MNANDPYFAAAEAPYLRQRITALESEIRTLNNVRSHYVGCIKALTKARGIPANQFLYLEDLDDDV